MQKLHFGKVFNEPSSHSSHGIGFATHPQYRWEAGNTCVDRVVRGNLLPLEQSSSQGRERRNDLCMGLLLADRAPVCY